MRFNNLVRGIAAGVFARFSARLNNHIAVCTLVTRQCADQQQLVPPDLQQRSPIDSMVGTTIKRHYTCTSSGKILTAFNLHEWEHVETIYVADPDHVLITDDLKWPQCSAKRSYWLKRDLKSRHGITRKNDPWFLECNRSLLSMQTLREKMRHNLKKTDSQVFNAYVEFIDDDSENVFGDMSHQQPEATPDYSTDSFMDRIGWWMFD